METAIVSIICVVLILVGGMTMSQGFITSADSISGGEAQMSERDGEIMRTELTALSAGISIDFGGNLAISLRNSGQTKLADFDRWDVIVQYNDGIGNYYIRWLPYYAEAPASNGWTVHGIYLDAASEAPAPFDPGILNPGEEIVLEARLNPAVGTLTTNQVTVSTPNGIPVSVSFSGSD